MRSRKFAIYAWGVLAYNVLVILWGAFVRATGSGAGCGSHWPLCNGVVAPPSPQLETIIELSHRLTSALSVALIAGLIVWGFRLYAQGHPVRKSVIFSGIFIITEALLGAGLVLFGLVADNDSVTRALVVALHLANTFLLLAALALTAWAASGKPAARLRGRGWLHGGWWLALAAVAAVGMSGAVTALGDTLFPASSLAEGIRQDFLPTAHILVRMRTWHPILAILTGAYVVLLAQRLAHYLPNARTQKLARLQVALYIIQGVGGIVNVILLAPVWMQLVHLLLADLVWITLVLLGAAAFTRSVSPHALGGQPPHP